MSETKSVLDLIKEREVKYVDFRFTDPRGKWQHLTYHERTITEDLLREGLMFDGSAIAGWQAVNVSDGMTGWAVAERPMISETGAEPYVA